MLPKNSSCVEYYTAKQAKREAKEARLRRLQEKAERLAAQEAEHKARLARKEAERYAAQRAAYNLKYGYSTRYYTPPPPPVKEKPQEFLPRADRTRKQHEYMRIVGAPNSNRRRRMRLAPPMDLISEDFGNKGLGKIKGLEITTRWSSSHV